MKKKNGFTLAEVLVTLGIIGVVAALATPQLLDNTQKAKVVPSIRKFITTMENVHEHIMADEECDKLSEVNKNNDEGYLDLVKKYVKGRVETKKMDEFEPKPANIKGEQTNAPGYGSSYTFSVYTFENGDAMAIHVFAPEINANYEGTTYKGHIANIWYDINGFENKPNRAGKDEFLFRVDDSGTVYPDGGQVKKMLTVGRADTWDKDGYSACKADSVPYGQFCAASIADNNWKIIYKY